MQVRTAPGKSTFFYIQLSDRFPVFVNADEIAKKLTGLPENSREVAAAEQAEILRRSLIADGTSFALETVFSRTGFFVALFFICTESPVLNAARVATRVQEGGHTVPIEKIESRYSGSIRTAVRAIGMVDELWLYDNSERNESPLLIAIIVAGKIEYLATRRPRWTEPFTQSRSA